MNIAVFHALLFVAAYRLPGGIAATVGAVQPLIVVFLAGALLGRRVRSLSVGAALAGIVGVAILVLQSDAMLDSLGLAAALAGAMSMALGVVLTRKWQPPVSPLVLIAWQLAAGGLLLAPVALWFEPALPSPSYARLVGFAYLVVFTAITYTLWFCGIRRIDAAATSSLSFLSPLMAVLLGWVILGQSLSPVQIAGAAIIIGSVWLSQRSERRPDVLADTARGKPGGAASPGS